MADELVRQFPDYIQKTDQVITLVTANGSAVCDEESTHYNPDVEERAVAVVLPDTPTVFAMGVACIRLGWHFEWPSFSFSPFAVKPGGIIVYFVVRDPWGLCLTRLVFTRLTHQEPAARVPFLVFVAFTFAVFTISHCRN